VTSVRFSKLATAGDVAVDIFKSPTLSCAGRRRFVHDESMLMTSKSGREDASCGEPNDR